MTFGLLRGAASIVMSCSVAAVIGATGPAMADPRVPTATEWQTDHGYVSMKISPDHTRIDATWQITDGDTGQLHLTLGNGGIYSGYWTADRYFEKCSLSRDFTFYWGNISMIFDSDKGIFAAKDDFCGKHKDKKFEVWKGWAQASTNTTTIPTPPPQDTTPPPPKVTPPHTNTTTTPPPSTPPLTTTTTPNVPSHIRPSLNRLAAKLPGFL